MPPFPRASVEVSAFEVSVANQDREEDMAIRRGDVVSHSKAIEWGVGKVVEVTLERISIEFNDGTTRKIAGSHVANLLPAAAALYIPCAASVAAVTKGAPKVPRAKKAPKAKAVAKA
jgi:hypothetical protein